MISTTVEEPWSFLTTEEYSEDRRFLKILWLTLAVFVVVGLIIPLVTVPQAEQQMNELIEQRVAKLLIKKEPPPEPSVKEKKPKAKQKTKPPPELIERKQTIIKKAREKASRSGLLAMKSELTDLNKNRVIANIRKKRTLTSAVESQADKSLSTSMLDASVVKTSQALDEHVLSVELAEVELADRQVTHIEYPDIVDEDAQPGQQTGESELGRSHEEIQMVMDSSKGKLNALYNRALRRNPVLAGKLMLKLTIAPSGDVLDCKILSSELNNPELEKKLVNRILLFRFDSRDVPEITVNYPIGFYPR